MTASTGNQHTDPTYECELPDGTVYRVVPPEVGVPVIRKWLEHDWPMTVKEGLTLRDQLGWESDPEDPTLFTTNHNIKEADSWIIDINDEVNSFRISLASFAPIDADAETTPITRCAYNEYVELLTSVYGLGRSADDDDSSSTRWLFPSQSSLRIGMTGSVLTCTINSPAANYAAAAEAELLEWEAADDGDEKSGWIVIAGGDRVMDDERCCECMVYERELPDGTVFRVVPPEVGVPVIRLWLEHEWPMSVREGLELRDRLGWRSSPTMETMFTTGHDLGGKDAYFIDLKGQVNSFHMGLASRIPKASAPPEAAVLVRRAYGQYVEVLAGLYGAGTTKHSRGRNGPQESTTWVLPNGASLRLGTVGRVLSITVDSPATAPGCAPA
ncbi:DUF6301 family protein [Actinomyces ruminicola]|uniref:Uncharacterized protein n=1 Tax=Actinomyces ruminicola TaxID=332524 RepID=A0A1G9SCJ7_9ACTO|nr:DUF6301 family protein [Actinomyces ruminicola]SDM32525.1 hypothetical protein SAMN04487766_101374 [Actinomyces ruminicola]